MKSTHAKGKGMGNRPSALCQPHKSDFRKPVGQGQDTHFSYNMTVLIGCSAEVTTRSGEKYEGIFVAYSAAQEIMLEAAHLIPDNDETAITTHFDVLVIPSDKLMAMKFENAVLGYATRDFQTDTAISAGRSPIANKELTPWDGGDGEASIDDMDLGEVESGTNGWAPGEMFKKNAEKYGIVSSYDQQLSGYTTSLDKTDHETFKKHEEKALQVAEEIEKSTVSSDRTNAENGDDEESKFSAVVRDTLFNNDSSTYSNAIMNNNNNNRVILNNTTSEINRTDKYVPPSRRNQNQTQPAPMVQQPPPSTPPVNPVTASHSQGHHVQHPVTGGANRKPNYGGQRFTSATNSYYQQDQQRRSINDRRGPVQTQYGPSNHGDNGNRPGRGGKMSLDRRGPARDDPAKKELVDFSNTFTLTSGDNTQNRRPPPPLVNTGPSNPPPFQPGQNSLQRERLNNQNGCSATMASTIRNSHNASLTQKPLEKDKIITPNPTTVPAVAPSQSKVEKAGTPAHHQPPQRAQPPTPDATPAPEPLMPARKPSESPESACETGAEEKQGPCGVRVGSPAPSDTRSTVNSSDAKSSDSPDSRKPFTFNINAKEFNPTTKSFTPRSPATPPRPPSTPASTPQLIPMAQGHPTYIQMPPTAIYLPPPYTQTISPVANQGLSANNLQPHRHMNPHRKGMAVPQRAELSPAIPVQAAGPLLAQASLQSNGPSNHPYAAAYSIPPHHGFAQQVRIHAPGLVQMFNTEVGGDGNPVHLPVHYLHGGAAATGGHTTTPTVNVTGQNAIMPGSPHGYSQSGSHGPHQHHIYPFVGLPVVGVGYPHGPNPLINQRNYYEQ